MIIPLQSYGLVPVVSGFSPDRAIANTGGPWEMAAVAAFLLFYFWSTVIFILCFFPCNFDLDRVARYFGSSAVILVAEFESLPFRGGS